MEKMMHEARGKRAEEKRHEIEERHEEKRDAPVRMKPASAGVGNETSADMAGAFSMGRGGKPPRPEPVGKVKGRNENPKVGEMD